MISLTGMLFLLCIWRQFFPSKSAKHWERKYSQINLHSNITVSFNTVESVVKFAYPDHTWDHDKFPQSGSRKKLQSQLFLERIVRTLFPDNEVISNAKAAHGIINASGAPLEIDVFLPELNLGFEYQVLFPSFSDTTNERTGSAPLFYYELWNFHLFRVSNN